VIGLGDRRVPVLYMTASEQGSAGNGQSYQMAKEGLALPAELWSDLSSVLELIVVAQYSEYAAGRDRFVADALVPFLARVEALTRSAAFGSTWKPESRGRVRWALGLAQTTYGEQKGDGEALGRA